MTPSIKAKKKKLVSCIEIYKTFLLFKNFQPVFALIYFGIIKILAFYFDMIFSTRLVIKYDKNY